MSYGLAQAPLLELCVHRVRHEVVERAHARGDGCQDPQQDAQDTGQGGSGEGADGVGEEVG